MRQITLRRGSYCSPEVARHLMGRVLEVENEFCSEGVDVVSAWACPGGLPDVVNGGFDVFEEVESDSAIDSVC